MHGIAYSTPKAFIHNTPSSQYQTARLRRGHHCNNIAPASLAFAAGGRLKSHRKCTREWRFDIIFHHHTSAVFSSIHEDALVYGGKKIRHSLVLPQRYSNSARTLPLLDYCCCCCIMIQHSLSWVQQQQQKSIQSVFFVLQQLISPRICNTCSVQWSRGE